MDTIRFFVSFQSIRDSMVKKTEIQRRREAARGVVQAFEFRLEVQSSGVVITPLFSKGESDLCVAKAGEVCLLQGRATSWTTGPRCLCIRTCALSPYVCSR